MAHVVHLAPEKERKHGCIAELTGQFGTMGHRLTAESIVRCSCGQLWRLSSRYTWVREVAE